MFCRKVRKAKLPREERDLFERYGEIDRAVGAIRVTPAPPGPAARARETLAARLADLRSRLVAYRIFASPLGRLLIARSEHGVTLVEYLDEGAGFEASRLRRAGVDAAEDGGEIEALYRDVLDYLEGRRTRLDWRLDFRLSRSAFHRRVLDAAAAIPYAPPRARRPPGAQAKGWRWPRLRPRPPSSSS